MSTASAANIGCRALADIFWGDGAGSSGTIQFDPTTGIFSVLADHSYQEEGNYVIGLNLIGS